MTPNPFDLMLAQHSFNDVLLAAIKTTKFELESAAGNLRSQDVGKLAEYSVGVCRSTAIQSALICGGILELVAIASREEQTPEIYQEVISEIGISRTQAYRCRAIWRFFGSTLFDSPDLMPAFCSESLKLLTEGEATDQARSAALEMAKSGQTITIKVAKKLRSSHAEAAADKAEQIAKAKSQPQEATDSNSIWNFAGQVVDIVLTPRSSAGLANVAAVVGDLNLAIEALCRSESDYPATS